MKRPCLALLVFCQITITAAQNRIVTETEIGANAPKDRFFSQYFFYTYAPERKVLGLSVLTHFFYQEKVPNQERALKRMEFGGGPHFNGGAYMFSTFIGRTSDKQTLAAVTMFATLPRSLQMLAIADIKIGPDKKYTWFRKVSFGGSSLYLRWEDFYAGDASKDDGIVFGRIGPEIRASPSEKVEIYANPFYDYKNRLLGFQAGVRIKGFQF